MDVGPAAIPFIIPRRPERGQGYIRTSPISNDTVRIMARRSKGERRRRGGGRDHVRGVKWRKGYNEEKATQQHNNQGSGGKAQGASVTVAGCAIRRGRLHHAQIKHEPCQDGDSHCPSVQNMRVDRIEKTEAMCVSGPHRKADRGL